MPENYVHCGGYVAAARRCEGCPGAHSQGCLVRTCTANCLVSAVVRAVRSLRFSMSAKVRSSLSFSSSACNIHAKREAGQAAGLIRITKVQVMSSSQCQGRAPAAHPLPLRF